MTNNKQPRTLAITLNWRQPFVTLECVEALQAMQNPGLDILVIDNGSGDESVETLRDYQNPAFEILELPQNVGFAAGNNYGLRLAIEIGYDFALLVNNDAFAAPEMLDRLLAETADDIGLLSPKIYYETEPDRIWFAGGRRQAYTLDLVDTGRGEMDSQQEISSHDVDYLLGACMLVNLQAARVVGLLDERYFFYYEDLDWSIRFKEAGYRIRLVPKAYLYHRVAVSTGSDMDSAQRRYYLAYGGVLFWRQYAHLGNRAVILGFRVISAVKMVGRLLLTGRWRVAAAYLHGLRDGWQVSKRGRFSAGL
ncbi:MAG: glycosyltransferase family 2 protein [Candidatus Promineifilaceae bacterium]